MKLPTIYLYLNKALPNKSLLPIPRYRYRAGATCPYYNRGLNSCPIMNFHANMYGRKSMNRWMGCVSE
uniref:Uncharacterized protein n=1 Tax=Picea glauca TaxID=3330 RepID=A0A101LW02_PICGL|nr:hypothetical protein ABT39_MTgene1498 [Picea glauca]